MDNLHDSSDNRRSEVRYPIDNDFLFVVKRWEEGTIMEKEADGKYVDLSLSGFCALTSYDVQAGNLIRLTRKGESLAFDVIWVAMSEGFYRFGCQIVH